MMLFRQHLLSRLMPVLFLILFYPGVASAKMLIGVIMTGDIPYYDTMHKSLAETLEKEFPAEEVEFIQQRPFPDPIAWSNAARKLIALEVDIIVSYGSPATQAVLFEKSNIPLVYAGVYDPERLVLQGKNVTGCGYNIPLSSLLRYFRQIKDINKLQVVYSSTEEDSVRQMIELDELAKKHKMKLAKLDMRSHNDLRKFNKIGKNDAVYFTGSCLAHMWIEDLHELLWKKRLPAVDIFPDTKELGMLITLYQPPEKQGEKAAEILARIIQGEQARKIDPEVLRDTELVFNLNGAKRLGIGVPVRLIVEATRVIR